MKRLGMWNRLALVAFVVISLSIPTYWHFEEVGRLQKLEQVGYDACMANKHYRPYEGKTQFEHCWGFWREDFKPVGPSLDNWGINVTMVAILSAIAYLLAWAAVATIKWIWRGRQAA